MQTWESLTDTTVAGKYINVMMVSTLTAAASFVLFSVSCRIVMFSFLASSASCLREDPFPWSNKLDS